MNDKQKNPSSLPLDTPLSSAELQDLQRRIQPEMRREKPSPDAIAAAMQAVQRLAAEIDAEDAAEDSATEAAAPASPGTCKVCGYQNRQGNKFCGMCGISVEEAEIAVSGIAKPPDPEPPVMIPPFPKKFPEPQELPIPRPAGNETHHYHHHYHHHYFPGAPDAAYPTAAEPARDAVRDVAREEKFRSMAALRGDLSRAEAAVRAITQEWVLACNTKHLDDLLELYSADALVLRSNCPPIRGAAAVREFFFGALDAGLGDVEFDPMRVDVVGELAYEAGRCKALIPSAAGKRREERGKYLWVLQKQPNGEWKVVADCWSSDLTLSTLESDVPAGAAVKTNVPRRTP